MSLEVYKQKRSFNKTPEPEGKQKKNSGAELLFVIQKHAASHLHYDFRLELKGTLKSWAVPKGPSLNPQDKRLAMLVEDHPFDYKDFEGVIPKGNYGAGQVIIWDQGTYEPAEKGATRTEKEKILLKEFHSGSMRIIMHGKKIKGEFALVKSSNREENAWLLIKKTDRYASETDITKKNKSVVSGKTIEDLTREKSPKTWQSNRNSNGQLKKRVVKQAPVVEEIADTNPDYASIISNLLAALPKKKSAMPEDLRPMLATLVDHPIDAPGWIYEVKWDGYRSLAYLKKGKVDLRSRNNNNFNKKFFPVAKALEEWTINAVVDGEIVVLNEKGLSDFGKLQNWTSEADGELVFYVFDILWLEGINLINLTVTERRNILQQLPPPEGIIRISESFESSGSEFFAVADELGLEGIIAKKSDSTYIPDSRSKSWLKIKTEKRHEAVIAGYTRNEDSSKQFSALVLGVYDEKKELKFIGQVGTGFTDQVQTELLKKMKPLIAKKSPFPEEPIINKPTKFRPRPPKANVVWLKPQLVCEVKYAELTSDGIMRHPSYQGLRSDKKAKDVKEEKSLPVEHVINEETDQPETIADSSSKKKKVTGTRAKQSQEPPENNEAVIKRKTTKGKRKVLLNEKETNQVINIDGHEIKFTNLDKIYWPKEKITKRDMINYYYQLAPLMLTYMKDRPQSLNRYPDGINGESFYQKNVAGKVPDWISTHAYENTTRDGNKTFYVCTDEASLLYIANLGCIEMNPWHSRIDNPDNPDWCVIDLDPDTNTFQQVIDAANVVKEILDSFSIPSFPKTSGSTGIHIYIPLGAEYTYDQSKQLAELIVTFAHEELRSFTSLERSPAKRKGKIYLDFLQNRAIQTIAAPYSLRPKPGATASAPLQWDEIKKGLSIQDFTIYNMADRVKETGDLFKGVLGEGIDIAAVLDKIAGK
jgi:bifunctional non-homologous end joining protein LigD